MGLFGLVMGLLEENVSPSTKLACAWAYLGLLGLILGPCWPISDLSEAVWGQFWPTCAGFGPILAYFEVIFGLLGWFWPISQTGHSLEVL